MYGNGKALADNLFVLKTATGLRFESLAAVEWLEADRNHVIFHILGREPVRVRAKFSELESALEAARFLRISRSSMVNLAHVLQAESLQGGRYLFELQSGFKLQASRSRAAAIRKLAAKMRHT
jgi:two-component system LytT family response regulator